MTAPAPQQQYVPQPPSAADFMLGGASRKGRSASFRNLNDEFLGRIIDRNDVVTVQKRDPDDGTPQFYRNSSDPIWQIVIPCNTSQRSPEIEGDDGVRYLYIDGSRQQGCRSKHDALATAMRAVGATDFETDAEIWMKYTNDGPKGPNSSPVSNPPKQYDARYTRPQSGAAQAMGLALQNGSELAQPQPPAQPAAPAAPGPVQDQAGTDPRITAGLAHLPVEQQNAFVAAGMTFEQLRDMGFIKG